ncbi:NepR family anti-sigma factor [Microbaculum sp. FT89]|uniref:NepR family anti-sigma factor n=1 Tax=Microbaculum sp. FT89 TaxID=3447298 RepID=UPI003F5295B0
MSSDDESKHDVTKPESQTEASAALDEGLQAHIGVQLKSMYDSYLNEPIPDRLVELLEQLDRVSRESGPDASPDSHRARREGSGGESDE